MTPSEPPAIAAELDKANAERRWAEQKVIEAAERASAALLPIRPRRRPSSSPGRAGIRVWWGSRPRGWSSATRHGADLAGGRPGGAPPAASPGFDLVAALDACSEHLSRHGGHRAAAGLELEPGRLEAFREAFLAHAGSEIDRDGPHRAARRPRRRGAGRDRDGARRAAREPRALRDGEPRAASLGALGPTTRGPPPRRGGKHSAFSSRAAPAGPSESPSG